MSSTSPTKNDTSVELAISQSCRWCLPLNKCNNPNHQINLHSFCALIILCEWNKLFPSLQSNWHLSSLYSIFWVCLNDLSYGLANFQLFPATSTGYAPLPILLLDTVGFLIVNHRTPFALLEPAVYSPMRYSQKLCMVVSHAHLLCRFQCTTSW